MAYMFFGCKNLESLDLSHFDTTSITGTCGISSMFEECTKLTSLDISNFDISKDIWIYHEFENCSSLATIKTPKKSGEEVPDLPEGTWKDSSGNTYTTLPANATESITLTKE